MNPYSQKLFNAFKLKYIAIYLVLISLTFYFLLKSNLAIITCLFAFIKLEMCWLYSIGHGVYDRKKILGMLVPVAVSVPLMVISLILLVILAPKALSEFPNDLHNLNMFVVGLLTGIFLAILRWYFTMNYITWHGSEIRLREILKSKGWGEKEINTRISYCRKEGWLDEQPYC